MARFFLTLAWIMLLLLLVDSAMNDPDVKPIVDRQVQRAGETVSTVVNWFGAQDAESKGEAAYANFSSSVLQTTADGSPASNWYWSTMLATAVVLLRRALFVQAIPVRVRPVTAPVWLNSGVRLAGRQA